MPKKSCCYSEAGSISDNSAELVEEPDAAIFRGILFYNSSLSLKPSTDSFILGEDAYTNTSVDITIDSSKAEEINWYQNCDVDSMFRGDCMLPISPRPNEEIFS